MCLYLKPTYINIVCLYSLALSFFSNLIFIQPKFPHEAFFVCLHPTFFILLSISCFLHCEPMVHAQPRPIDDLLLNLQDNHISNQVWEGQERMICLRYNTIWAFTHLDRIDNCVKDLIALCYKCWKNWY